MTTDTAHDLRSALEPYTVHLVAEEASEAIQMTGKWGRFGPDHARRDGMTARVGLALELGDVLAAIDFAICAGLIDAQAMLCQREVKFARLTDPDAADDEGRRLAPPLPSEEARLHIALAAPATDEPVAWMWDYRVRFRDDGNDWSIGTTGTRKPPMDNPDYRNIRPLYAHPLAAEPVGLRAELASAYEKVKLFPEERGDPMTVGGQGFMDLLALRNVVADVLDCTCLPFAQKDGDCAYHATPARTDDAAQAGGDVAAMREAAAMAVEALRDKIGVEMEADRHQRHVLSLALDRIRALPLPSQDVEPAATSAKNAPVQDGLTSREEGQ